MARGLPVANSTSCHMDGWPPASTGRCPAYLDGVLYGQVGRRHTGRDDNPSEGRLDPAQRSSEKRSRHTDRILDTTWQLPVGGECRRRSGLSHGAVRAHGGPDPRPRVSDWRVSMLPEGRNRFAARLCRLPVTREEYGYPGLCRQTENTTRG